MKIAIVGAGIVGSTAAYYLSKEKGVEVTLFDHGLGQATKAAAVLAGEFVLSTTPSK